MFQHRGFSLLELMLVIIVVVTIAAVSLQSVEPTEVSKVEAASADIVDALFFARSEALRTGGEAGVFFGVDGGLQATANMVTVFAGSSGSRMISKHPLTGNSYQIDIMHAAFGNGVALFDLATNQQISGAIVFNGAPGKAGAPELTAQGQIGVRLGVAQRIIAVDVETGRISVN